MAVKLGMLGMWHTHAHGIVQQVAAHPDEFRLAGFYDPDAGLAADRQAKWQPLLKEVRVCKSPPELLNLDLDGVVVEGQVYQNLEWARLALESGRPVLLEKPAGVDFQAFHRLIELAQRKHLFVQMLYLFRYMSALVKLLELAKGGALGDVYLFRARLPKDLPSYSRYVAELSRYAGGIFFEMAGHVIDPMVAILGKPRRTTGFLAHHHRVPGQFIDNGVALFEFERAWGIIEVPALETAPHSRRIEVYGTKGAAVIPHLGSGHLANRAIQPIEVFRDQASDWQRLDLPAATLQITDLREFAACRAGTKAPNYSHEHDLVVQEALLRASGMWR